MKVDVFISWSGALSMKVAASLAGWLPCVLQCAKPCFTPNDITKGKQWFGRLEDGLRRARVGVLCLTAENLGSPWMHFEAGYLLASAGQGLVCPLLVGISPADVPLPLGVFQATTMDRDDVHKLVVAINGQAEADAAQEAALAMAFDALWPRLASEVAAAIKDCAALAVRGPAGPVGGSRAPEDAPGLDEDPEGIMVHLSRLGRAEERVLASGLGMDRAVLSMHLADLKQRGYVGRQGSVVGRTDWWTTDEGTRYLLKRGLITTRPQ